jgi:hypothetical protein
MSSVKPGGRRDVPLRRFWRWATRKENLQCLRLLYEIQIVAVQNPREYGRYLKKASLDWQTIVFNALSESVRSDTMSTLCIAVFDGLLLEMINTGERARLTRALERFIAMTPVSGKRSNDE